MLCFSSFSSHIGLLLTCRFIILIDTLTSKTIWLMPWHARLLFAQSGYLYCMLGILFFFLYEFSFLSSDILIHAMTLRAFHPGRACHTISIGFLPTYSVETAKSTRIRYRESIRSQYYW